MLRLLGHTLLTLSVALPGASWALGLGDIHVNSALHQRLVAQIDLVGATNEELPKLNGGIANDETFQHYGLERPAFLAGTSVIVGQDRQGRPILTLRSMEPFTEPMVTFLVDLHSPNGELIREYTVLLDPPGLTTEPSGVESAPAAPAAPATTPTNVADPSSTVAEPERVDAAPDTKLPGKTHTVAARDTLDRIVSIAGAHSGSDRHRMMIAIFRANPAAFRANLNLLRIGATLHIPSPEQLSAISAEDANRDYDAQMAAWRATDRRAAPAAATVAAAAAGPATLTPAPASTSAPASTASATQPTVDAKPEAESQDTDNAALAQRVQSLEQSLDKLRQELKQTPAPHTAAPVVANSAPTADTATTESGDSEDESPPPVLNGTRIALLVIGIGLTLAGSVWVYLRRRNRNSTPAWPRQPLDAQPSRVAEQVQHLETSTAAQTLPQAAVRAPSTLVEEAKDPTNQAEPKTPGSESNWFKDSFSTPIGDLLANELATKLGEAPPAVDSGAWAAQVLNAAVEKGGDTVEQKFGFFNPESNANTTHVVLDSGLKEPPPFVERRRNPADVLRQAIEREPDRSDLRLKLLELYYTAAEQNRRAFLEATHQLAKNEQLASAEDWSRIADMGRAIAPEDELFADRADDKAVA
jgi:pilus assembly protein FimV